MQNQQTTRNRTYYFGQCLNPSCRYSPCTFFDPTSYDEKKCKHCCCLNSEHELLHILEEEICTDLHTGYVKINKRMFDCRSRFPPVQNFHKEFPAKNLSSDPSFSGGHGVHWKSPGETVKLFQRLGVFPTPLKTAQVPVAPDTDTTQVLLSDDELSLDLSITGSRKKAKKCL